MEADLRIVPFAWAMATVATIDLSLPPGTTFNSDSGVFLSDREPSPVPTPDSLPLLAAALVALLLLRVGVSTLLRAAASPPWTNQRVASMARFALTVNPCRRIFAESIGKRFHGERGDCRHASTEGRVPCER
jgi:hypothetical protein